MAGYFSSFKEWLWPTWKRGGRYALPVMAEKTLRTLMRTTDVLVTGFFSPTAVAAVGLAGIYSRVLTRVGLAVGDATIALSSQDTGSGATENRSEAITQSILIGFLAGVPFAAFGLLFNYSAIAVLGAESEVVRLGGQYLAIIMVAAPSIHVAYIGARALQGMGNTRTPMYINGFANTLNIVGTVTLAFGLGPFPPLNAVGIALATAIGETLAASLFLVALYGRRSDVSFACPTDSTITKQLVLVSAPRFVEGIAEMIVVFPFNAVLLAIGTEANAAYHIGRRIYRQVVNPFTAGYGVAANILVGQSLGGGEVEAAYSNGVATALLGVVTVSSLSLLLFGRAGFFVRLFIDDPTTVEYAVGFVRAYAVAAVFIATFKILAGSLRGGSETRVPFVATLAGTSVFLLGVSYVGGLYFGYGALAVYSAIILDYVCRMGFVVVAFYRRNWVDYGTALMEERESASDE